MISFELEVLIVEVLVGSFTSLLVKDIFYLLFVGSCGLEEGGVSEADAEEVGVGGDNDDCV